MMTLDEAIKHAEEKAKELYCKADEDYFFDGDWGKKCHCTECAKEHEQLANWLKELKRHSWIPVNKKIPETHGYYLTSTIYNQVYCDYWNGDCFDRTETVVAWMPLPEPYTEEETT